MDKMDKTEEIYDPAKPYAILADRHANPEMLLDLFISQTAPALPNQVVIGEGKQKCVNGILEVFNRLKQNWIKHLRDLGFERAADAVERSKRLPNLAEILRKIPADTSEQKDSRRIVHEILESERDSMDSEILNCLGFLPKGIFVGIEDKLLQDNLPEHVKLNQTDPKKLWSALSAGDLSEYPMYQRLYEWMRDANKEFSECVRYAFFNISKFLNTVAPEGFESQPYGQMCDIETQSLTSLLAIVFDKTRPLMIRFESLRLVEESIRLFSIKRNPVYRAQQKVRKQVHTILQTDFWDQGGKLCSLVIDSDRLTRIQQEEGQDAAGMDESRAIKLKARYVNEKVRAILEKYLNFISPQHKDKLLFDSGEKTPASLSRKMVLMQELARKCQSCLDGAKTDIQPRYARRKLAEMRKTLQERGKDVDLFSVKPITFDALDDHVRFRVAIDFVKFLNEYDLEDTTERDDIDGFFTELADYLISQLNLRNVRTENYLWTSNDGNLKSNSNFKVFKCHGDYSVTGEIFKNGRLVEHDIVVPVEIQLLPLESYLRLSGHGPTSTHRYSDRKAMDIMGRFRPSSIGNRQLYSERINIEDITRAIEEE